MGRSRADQYEVTLDGPEASFNSATGLFSGSQLTDIIFNLGGLESLDNELIEDPRYTVGGGTHEQIEGLAYKRIGLTYSTLCEGLQGTGVADTETAAATAVTRRLQACLGSAGDLTDSDQITGVPTTTALENTTAGASAVSASTIGLTLVELDDGSYEWAPYTYASPDLTLLMALSSVPSTGNLTLGAAVIPYEWRWSGSIGFSLVQRIVNADGGATTDYTVLGSFGTFSIPDTSVDGVPQIDWSWMGAAFTDLSDLTAGTPASVPGVVLAGTDVAIGAYGSTVVTRPCVESIAFDLNADYEWSPCVSRENSAGVSGADRSGGTPSLRLILRDDAAPPGAITSGASHYRTSRIAKGDEYHVKVGIAQGGPGKAFCLYMPRCIAWDVQHTVVENRICQVVDFRPVAGLDEPHVIVAQA